jgi:hypothetical protein
MELTKNWRLVNEKNTSTITLQFHEQRVRTKKNEETEKYEYVDNYYYPNIKTALTAFLRYYTGDAKDVKGVLGRICEVEDLISKIWLNK